jgi:hypothetical protein
MSSFVEHAALLGAARRKTVAAISRQLAWPESESDSLDKVLAAQPSLHPVLRARTAVAAISALRGALRPEQAGFVFISVVGLSAAEGARAASIAASCHM